MKLNDDILTSAGAAWHDWEPFNPGWYASSVSNFFRERAQTALESEFGASRLFVLKDPRVCRLLGFWIEAAEDFGATPVIISPIRSPLEVAASLQVRDGIDSSIGQLLWLRHVLDAEAASRNLRRAFLRFDDLLSDWQAVADELGETLGISWPRRSTSVALEIEALISPAQRHHREDDSCVRGNLSLSPWIRSTFEILARWADGEIRETDKADLDRIRSAFDEAASTFSRPVLAGRHRTYWSRSLAAYVDELEAKLAELAAELCARDGQAKELAAQLAAGDARARNLSAKLSAAKKLEAKLAAKLMAQKLETKGFRTKLAAQARAIQRFENSTSWRLTAPLRGLSRRVQGFLGKLSRAVNKEQKL